jgi:hypothetical protein
MRPSRLMMLPEPEKHPKSRPPLRESSWMIWTVAVAIDSVSGPANPSTVVVVAGIVVVVVVGASVVLDGGGTVVSASPELQAAATSASAASSTAHRPVRASRAFTRQVSHMGARFGCRRGSQLAFR